MAARRGLCVVVGHVFVVGPPLLWLELGVLEVCCVEVRAETLLARCYVEDCAKLHKTYFLKIDVVNGM